MAPAPSAGAAAATIFLCFLLTSGSALVAAERHHFSTVLSPANLGLRRREKLSHLHFYFHDILAGRNPTAVRVVEPPPSNASRTLFGAVVMTDDPLTERPEIGSKLLGRAQGMYASASQTEFGFLMVMNFAFVEGKYNGSYLSILGRNTVMSAVREMPVVGGGGLFRFARGYAQARTHTVDFATGDAVVEYNVYVFHY
ncbi:dirigent protein 22-like [Momordica charantia]|uniref:Dirigent protein n=1 Tax=Momordica charantia TaxID=3673 RepID=A0A6J1DEM4_MOMCH|nr:dirigent protein 22-like [Momordica charantia]